MEVVATVQETASLISKSGHNDYLVFPEDRMNVIKMTDQLPYRWIQNGLQSSFGGEASKGEFYTYQLGVFALEHLEDLTVKFSDLKDGKGNIIAAKKYFLHQHIRG